MADPNANERFGPVLWRDPRFQPAIDSVRRKCNAISADYEDDPFIGMCVSFSLISWRCQPYQLIFNKCFISHILLSSYRLLDRYSWDETKVCELYRRSIARRKELGVDHVKREIVEGNLTVDQLPYAQQVKQMISINGVTSLEKIGKLAGAEGADHDCLIDGKLVKYGDVIGCYEMRYGHGKGKPLARSSFTAAAPPCELSAHSLGDDAASAAHTQRTGEVVATSTGVASSWSNWWCGATTSGSGSGSCTPCDAAPDAELTPAQFTRYMVYVTQWRWLQCENYIRRHGELGFWSMIHDCSCPQGYVSLWTRMRSLLGQYMPPVEEAWYASSASKVLLYTVPKVMSQLRSTLISLAHAIST